MRSVNLENKVLKIVDKYFSARDAYGMWVGTLLISLSASLISINSYTLMEMVW